MMNDHWQLRVYDSGHLYVADLSGAADIGRQQTKEETQPSHVRTKDGWRVVIAPMEDISISRQHLGVEPLADGRFLLTNKSAKLLVSLPNNQDLAPGESSKVALPVVVRVGRKMLRLQPFQEDELLKSLPLATLAPGSDSPLPGLRVNFGQRGAEGMDADQLLAWIQAFLGLLQSAAGSEDFYAKAAAALVDLVKLDSGRVVFRAAEKWVERAVHLSTQKKSLAEWRPSTRILNNVAREKKTFWQVPELGSSTVGLDAVVAAPILDRKGEVIGALYGERRVTGIEVGEPLTQVEALLVEVLATGVAAGLARVEQEQAALRTRTQMEQFFTPELAAELADHPELLVGRETEVTVLFCDIRGFSRITEKLGPAKTVELMSDVMSVLTQCVRDFNGVVVDYVGDEIMAMWGAPKDQPDHPTRACRAALAMFESLPLLNERWHATTVEPLTFGIGISSGFAQVGNVGSRIKFKYGALGNTVNLGSRVQGATKHLKSSLLITGATQARLDASFATRRLCQVRVVNIEQPITLHELVPLSKPNREVLKKEYEQALEEFNHGEFRQACRILGRLILDHPNDGPALILLSRAVACLVEKPNPFDPVMTLDGK
ncbi:MAG: adenylate/guanylate cyclase domain-containing protein [Planctomycetes bacterium]|nr:adenylate/guanylate cyclase domain-containing protein [Planctomycetota bacterium]